MKLCFCRTIWISCIINVKVNKYMYACKHVRNIKYSYKEVNSLFLRMNFETNKRIIHTLSNKIQKASVFFYLFFKQGDGVKGSFFFFHAFIIFAFFQIFIKVPTVSKYNLNSQLENWKLYYFKSNWGYWVDQDNI